MFVGVQYSTGNGSSTFIDAHYSSIDGAPTFADTQHPKVNGAPMFVNAPFRFEIVRHLLYEHKDIFLTLRNRLL